MQAGVDAARRRLAVRAECDDRARGDRRRLTARARRAHDPSIYKRHDEILTRCQEIVPSLAANAAKSERNRSLAPQSVAAMERIGLWRLLTPKRWGGWKPISVSRSPASAEITTAELLLDKIGAAFAALVSGERLPTLEERATLKWHASYVAELCRRASHRIFEAGGAHAVYDTAPIQTTLRDITTAARHAVCDFDTNAEMFGRVALGLDPGTPIL
jgi:hypothetical protein